MVGRLLRHRPHFLFWVDNDIFFLFKEIKPDIIFIKMDRRGRRSLQCKIKICLSLPSPYGEGNINNLYHACRDWRPRQSVMNGKIRT